MPASSLVYEVKDYIREVADAEDHKNDKQSQVRERVVLAGTPPEKWSRFQGFGQVSVRTPAGVIQSQITFSLPNSKTVEEAFLEMDAVLPEKAEEATKAIRRQVLEQMAQSKKAVSLPGIPDAELRRILRGN